MSKLIRNNRRCSPIYKKIEDITTSEMRKYVGAYLFAWDGYLNETLKSRAELFKDIEPSVILKITGTTIDDRWEYYTLKAIYGKRQKNLNKEENQGYIAIVSLTHKDWFITNDMKHIKETANKYRMHCYI